MYNPRNHNLPQSLPPQLQQQMLLQQQLQQQQQLHAQQQAAMLAQQQQHGQRGAPIAGQKVQQQQQQQHQQIPQRGVIPPHLQHMAQPQSQMNIPPPAGSGNLSVFTPAQLAQNKHIIYQPLKSATQWSEKLAKEGKEPNGDVKLYEQITTRDLTNKEALIKERFDENNPANPPGLFSNTSKQQILSRMAKNLQYYNELKLARMKTIQLSSTNKYTNTIWGEGYQGYGNGFTDGITRVLLPRQRKKFSRLNDIHITKKDMELQSMTKDEYVPIRLEFDTEKDKFNLRDTFVWNLNEKTITLENIVAVIMEDYRFSNPLFADAILTSIKEQIAEYNSYVYNFPYGEDMRILVKLDITISNNQLVDQFEWDISNPENNPEDFARIMCEELALPGEFITAISHSIREQAQLYTRALHLINYDFKGTFIDEDEIKQNLRSVITADQYLRPRFSLPQYTPQLLEISNNDLERLDKDRERESRRKRRQGRGGRRGGPVLPDLSDISRTFRTPVPTTVLPGGLDFGPDVQSYEEYTTMVERPLDPIRAQELQGQLRAKMDPSDTASNNSTNQSPLLILQDQSNSAKGGSTPRTPMGGVVKRGRAFYTHEYGSRCIVTIRLK